VQVSQGAKAKYVGKLDGFTVLNDTYDLCTEILATTDTPCPLGPGHIDAQSSDVVPDWVPSGALELKVTWTDQNSQNVLCIDFTLHIQ
jgi:ML domain